MTEQTEKQPRQNLQEFYPKQGDLVMLVYDKQVDCINDSVIIGEFFWYAFKQGKPKLDEFEGLCYLISEPEETVLGLTKCLSLKVPKIHKYSNHETILCSANRIYVGFDNVKKALEEDPVAKKLMFYN